MFTTCRACALPCETTTEYVPSYTFKATSNVLIPGVTDVTVTVTNVPAGMVLSTPKYKNPLYNGSTNLSQVIAKEGFNAAWVITYVPWESTMQLVTSLGSLDPSLTALDFPHELNSPVIITVPIPKYVTRLGTPLDSIVVQAWPVSTKTTCATFGWGLANGKDASTLLNSFLYSVVDAQGIVWAENVLDASVTQVAVDNLTPGSEYVFTIRGLHDMPSSTASTTVSNPVIIVTSLPYLGPNYTLSKPSVYDAVTNTWTLTVSYTDYDCISNIVAVANSSGTAAVVTRIGTTLPLEFSVTGVPPSSSLYVSLEALVAPACICGGTVGCCTVITGLLLLDTAPAPNVCADVQPVTNLTSKSIGALCLTVGWTPSPTASYGYLCTLFDSSFTIPLQSATIHSPTADTVSFLNLTPATTYGVTVAVFCDDEGETGADTSIQVTTVAACTPSLGPVVSSDVVITFAQTLTYTAVVSYGNFLCTTPVLNWSSTPPTAAQIVPPQSLTVPRWSVTGLPAGQTFTMKFTGTPIKFGTDCAASCCISTSIVPPAATFSFTTPSNTCGVVSNVLCTNATVSTLTFSWQWSGTSSSATIQYYYTDGSSISAETTIPTSQKSVTLTGLSASTTYTFYVRVVCGSTVGPYVSGTGTTAAVPPPPPVAYLPPFVQQEWSNPTFTPTSVTGVYVMTLTYPTDSATGIVRSTLLLVPDSTPPLDPIVISNAYTTFTTTVKYVDSPYTFYMSAEKTLDGSVIVSAMFSINVPSTPPAPAEKLFDLIIPHYAGPPKVFSTVCQKVTGDTQEALYRVLEEKGDPAPSQSYEQLSSMFEVYADMIVERFVKYRMQTPQTVLGYTGLHTPISRIYFGNVSDPALQNAITPVYTTHNDYSDWEASFSYNTALTAYPAPPGGLLSIPSSFAVPPFLVFYAKMMVYNWEMLSERYGNNSPVQLGATMYGSNKPDECWWFNAQVNTDGTITTITPTNPMQQPSVIDGTDNDGNGPSDSEQFYELAGWNCMERWFMHIAYCNQVLRGLIYARKIGTMTLEDLTPDNAVYFQISCLTFDGEGNSFPNTLYPDENSKKYPQYWQPWFTSVTPAMCNDVVALLWNKWFNQAPAPAALPSGNGLLKQSSWAQSYYAPAPRVYMPTTTFILPPAISMTTPGLIKNMTVSDLGTPQFSSVDYIFHEIYDTSDSQPTYFLGAQITAPTNLLLPDKITKGGANFDGIYDAANPSSTSNPEFLVYPEKYSAQYGTWDNVPGGMDGAFMTQSEITYIAADSTLRSGPVIVKDKNGNAVALTGAATVYNTQQGNQFCTLMNTSEFTPWQNAGATSWILTYNGAVTADNTDGAFKDYYALPWALEGSRYDLYNGQWAAAAAAAAGAGAPISYDAVKQGVHNADGSLLWSDLSTGLKPRVANIIKSAWNGIPTTPAGAGASQAAQVTQLTAALAGQIWMLSCQAGPFVNAMGVRASRRDGTGVSARADLLTFTYPGTEGSYSWPGWSGMKGQWWGVGTATNANVNVKAVLDQQNWGPADPTPAATIVSTGSTEDNFGVFSDYNIQFAAWVQMALDAQGIPASGSKRGAASTDGITKSVPVKYSTDGTGVPKLGCYELSYLPMSWFGPPPSL